MLRLRNLRLADAPRKSRWLAIRAFLGFTIEVAAAIRPSNALTPGGASSLVAVAGQTIDLPEVIQQIRQEVIDSRTGL